MFRISVLGIVFDFEWDFDYDCCCFCFLNLVLIFEWIIYLKRDDFKWVENDCVRNGL